MTRVKKYVLKHWYLLVIAVLMILFAYTIFDGNYYIGGDVMIPLYKGDILNKIYLWNSAGDSLEFLHLFWYLYFGFFSLINISGDMAQKILIITLFVVGFMSTTLLFKEVFANKYSQRWAYLSGLIYVLSPIYFLLVTAYLPLYGFPLCLYLLVRHLKDPGSKYVFLYSLAVNFFLFIDLPQPKIIIVFLMTCIGTGVLLRHNLKINYLDMIKSFFQINFFALLLNMWVVLPYIYSIFGGQISGFSGNVSAHNGTADLHTANAINISRFFNYSIVRIYPIIGNYLLSIPFTVWSFINLGLLAVSLWYSRKTVSRKNKALLLLFFLVATFMAKGPNPPFGEVYTKLILDFPLFRIFRTTSSVILGGLIFFSMLIPIVLSEISQKFKSKKVFTAYFVCLIIISYPIFLGHKYYNANQSPSEGRGYKIPKEYFSISQKLDSLDKNYSVLQLPFSDGYILKNWGYFGADILYWSSNSPRIHRPDQPGLSLEEYYGLGNFNVSNNTILNNVRHILIQKDTPDTPQCNFENLGKVAYSDIYFDLIEIDKEYYRPKVYATLTASTMSAGLSGRTLRFIDPTLRKSLCLELTENITKIDNGNLESNFQRVNPTKYQVNITTSNEKFTLVLNEKYNSDWKILGLSDDFKHLPVGGYSNGWEIDVSKMCQLLPKSCTTPSEGLKTIRIELYYFPQRLFWTGVSISLITSGLLLIYSIFSIRQKDK